MGGGDLLNLLIYRDVFEEDFTRFYVAEVNMAFRIFFSARVHQYTDDFGDRKLSSPRVYPQGH
jgi:hypothetical protein